MAMSMPLKIRRPCDKIDSFYPCDSYPCDSIFIFFHLPQDVMQRAEFVLRSLFEIMDDVPQEFHNLVEDFRWVMQYRVRNQIAKAAMSVSEGYPARCRFRAPPLTPHPHSSFQLLWFEGITHQQFAERCRAIGLNPQWVLNNNTGWRAYACRDLVNHFGPKRVEKIEVFFKVKLLGMRGGETVKEVVTVHIALSEAGGGCAVGAGGAAAAAAARPGFDFEVSALVRFLDFLLPLSLLTHLPAAAFASLCRRQLRCTGPSARLVGAAQTGRKAAGTKLKLFFY
jgi:hypothetical protein